MIAPKQHRTIAQCPSPLTKIIKAQLTLAKKLAPIIPRITAERMRKTLMAIMSSYAQPLALPANSIAIPSRTRPCG